MEKSKRKPLTTLHESIRRIEKRPPDPNGIEKFNELMRKDEEFDKKRREREREKKIARPRDAGATV